MSSNLLLVHEVQRGNPLLKSIKNVKIEFSKDITADYAMSSSCVLFVTVKYHQKHPKHAQKRIQEVGRSYRVRVLLVLVDDENNVSTLSELNKIAFSSEFTLILAWSNLEAARYLESLKIYEGKSSQSIQEKVETQFMPIFTRSLTSVRSINKTDVVTLLDVFGSFANICRANEEQLVLCPGLGEKKVKRLYQTLHEPFKRKKACEPRSESKVDDTRIEPFTDHDAGKILLQQDQQDIV
eukprot:gene12260-16440_t